MAGLNGKRLPLLDEIRGFCILCMMFYHGFYLCGRYAGVSLCNTLYTFFEPVQLLFASVFIFISGFCTQLSRSVAKRGVRLLCIAVALTAVTVLLLPRFGLSGFEDYFGILHLLACCMLLYALFRRAADRIQILVGVIGCMLLYVLTYMLPQGRIGLPFLSFALPQALTESRFLFPIGIIRDGFFSADYFPLLPHGFVFFAGIFVGRSVCGRPFSDAAFQMHIRFFAFVGRHSLTIYLLHVPIILCAILLVQQVL